MQSQRLYGRSIKNIRIIDRSGEEYGLTDRINRQNEMEQKYSSRDNSRMQYCSPNDKLKKETDYEIFSFKKQKQRQKEKYANNGKQNRFWNFNAENLCMNKFSKQKKRNSITMNESGKQIKNCKHSYSIQQIKHNNSIKHNDSVQDNSLGKMYKHYQSVREFKQNESNRRHKHHQSVREHKKSYIEKENKHKNSGIQQKHNKALKQDNTSKNLINNRKQRKKSTDSEIQSQYENLHRMIRCMQKKQENQKEEQSILQKQMREYQVCEQQNMKLRYQLQQLKDLMKLLLIQREEKSFQFINDD